MGFFDIGGSAKKVGKRIKELERLYGIQHGNNQHTSLPNNSVSTQSDLASQLGISVDTLQNYKMLSDMIPELEELVGARVQQKVFLSHKPNGGEPWFVGKDVASALGYSNASKAVSVHVSEEDRILKMLEADSQNGNVVKTQTALINESGLYALIFGSKLESAKRFKHYVMG